MFIGFCCHLSRAMATDEITDLLETAKQLRAKGNAAVAERILDYAVRDAACKRRYADVELLLSSKQTSPNLDSALLNFMGDLNDIELFDLPAIQTRYVNAGNTRFSEHRAEVYAANGQIPPSLREHVITPDEAFIAARASISASLKGHTECGGKLAELAYSASVSPDSSATDSIACALALSGRITDALRLSEVSESPSVYPVIASAYRKAIERDSSAAVDLVHRHLGNDTLDIAFAHAQVVVLLERAELWEEACQYVKEAIIDATKRADPASVSRSVQLLLLWGLAGRRRIPDGVLQSMRPVIADDIVTDVLFERMSESDRKTRTEFRCDAWWRKFSMSLSEDASMWARQEVIEASVLMLPLCYSQNDKATAAEIVSAVSAFAKTSKSGANTVDQAAKLLLAAAKVVADHETAAAAAPLFRHAWEKAKGEYGMETMILDELIIRHQTEIVNEFVQSDQMLILLAEFVSGYRLGENDTLHLQIHDEKVNEMLSASVRSNIRRSGCSVAKRGLPLVREKSLF
ncbi:MAG: hypothetical protein JNM43_23040 [Planctomycetaceae bacterium]|nr:hypothetical protein [Planctomycetaceae bacterium]